VVSCRLVLDVPRDLVSFVSGLLAAHRQIGTGNGARRLGCYRCREKTLSRTRVVRSGRRPASGILAFTITVAVIAVGVTAISGAAASASVRATSPQKAGVAELMKSYNPHGGLIGHSWWQAAVALSTLETYQQATGDTSYSNAIFTAFKDHEPGNFEDSDNDDTGWWGLAWLQAYDITGSRQYLAMAETDANYIYRSWDGRCGGGVWWWTSKTYKNAITNEVFLELTAWLHNTIRGDTRYLRWAKAEWSWFKGSGMINRSDLINDGLNSRCANNHQTTWTYNQGVILAGLAQLYKATKSSGLLRTAEGIGQAAISHLTIGGVLHEPPCEGGGCGNSNPGNAESFKGIFVRDLKVLAVTARTSQFSSFFEKQARSIEARDTNRHHQLGLLWAGPVIDLTSYSQASAEDALVAVLK
jgi:predicted alpha-1,6-mannanase (GH76 family)